MIEAMVRTGQDLGLLDLRSDMAAAAGRILADIAAADRAAALAASS